MKPRPPMTLLQENGVPTGALTYEAVNSVSLPPASAAVLLPMPPD